MILSSLLPAFTLGLKLLVPAYLVYALILGIYNRYFHKLRHFPGPFWASITPLWYWKTIRWEKGEDCQYPIHQKYGDIVRVAPNHLAVCNAAAIETIFMPKNGKVWKKGDFYDGFDPHVPGARTDGFSERNEVKHTERRRIVAPLYTQGSVLQYEPCVDRLISLFYDRMEMYARSGEKVDMSIWLKRYTFDVIGEIYYGKKEGFGMVRDGIDYKKWCHLMVSCLLCLIFNTDIWKDVMPSIGAAMTYFPLGFRTIYFASQLLWKEGRDAVLGMMALVKDAKEIVYERWDLMQSGADYPKGDMLTNLLDIVRDRGDKVGWSTADVHTEVWVSTRSAPIDYYQC